MYITTDFAKENFSTHMRDKNHSKVKLYLKLGFNPNKQIYKYSDSDTEILPLCFVMEAKDYKMFKLLLSYGADGNAYIYNSDRSFRKPLLYYATNHFPIKYMKVLLSLGKVNVDSKTTYGNVALYCVALSFITDPEEDYEKARLLLAYGANPNIADENGITPLHRASDPKIIKLFLENGAALSLNKKNKYGKTPLNGIRNEESVVLLINAGANIDTQDNGGNTPLHIAYANGYDDIIKILIANGGNTEIKNNEGKKFNEVKQSGFAILGSFLKAMTNVIEMLPIVIEEKYNKKTKEQKANTINSKENFQEIATAVGVVAAVSILVKWFQEDNPSSASFTYDSPPTRSSPSSASNSSYNFECNSQCEDAFDKASDDCWELPMGFSNGFIATSPKDACSQRVKEAINNCKDNFCN